MFKKVIADIKNKLDDFLTKYGFDPQITSGLHGNFTYFSDRNSPQLIVIVEDIHVDIPTQESNLHDFEVLLTNSRSILAAEGSLYSQKGSVSDLHQILNIVFPDFFSLPKTSKAQLLKAWDPNLQASDVFSVVNNVPIFGIEGLDLTEDTNGLGTLLQRNTDMFINCTKLQAITNKNVIICVGSKHTEGIVELAEKNGSSILVLSSPRINIDTSTRPDCVFYDGVYATKTHQVILSKALDKKIEQYQAIGFNPRSIKARYKEILQHVEEFSKLDELVYRDERTSNYTYSAVALQLYLAMTLAINLLVRNIYLQAKKRAFISKELQGLTSKLNTVGVKIALQSSLLLDGKVLEASALESEKMNILRKRMASRKYFFKK